MTEHGDERRSMREVREAPPVPLDDLYAAANVQVAAVKYLKSLAGVRPGITAVPLPDYWTGPLQGEMNRLTDPASGTQWSGVDVMASRQAQWRAELALSKCLQLPRVPGARFADGTGVVGGAHTRWSATDARLRIWPWDSNDERFFLVTGMAPNFSVRGWCLAGDAKRRTWLTGAGPGGILPAYLVPPPELCPVSSPRGQGSPGPTWTFSVSEDETSALVRAEEALRSLGRIRVKEGERVRGEIVVSEEDTSAIVQYRADFSTGRRPQIDLSSGERPEPFRSTGLSQTEVMAVGEITKRMDAYLVEGGASCADCGHLLALHSGGPISIRTRFSGPGCVVFREDGEGTLERCGCSVPDTRS